MLYTNYNGCCRLFQTTIKNRKVPHLKNTDLNRIQVTTLTCCNIQVKQRCCTMLAAATGNCAVTNVTYNENKYDVVTWTVYLKSSLYLRRRQWPCQIVVMCRIACWFRNGAVLKFDQFYHSSVGLPDHLKLFKDIMVFKEIRWATFVSVCRGWRNGRLAPWKLGIRIKKF